MKLTKKLEAEVKEVYRDFWESLLAVDLKKFNALLDDDFRQIGTTDGEVFFTRQAASKFLKATAEQLVGNLELRNQKLKIEALDKQVLITDLSDAYVKIDNEWTFYSRVRNTFLLHQTKDGWKFLLQHSSVPDHRADEGETIGLEKISKENLELREAVKRRTVELENKTRELEIETSLEKVRTVAMGMKKRDDMLDICRTISTQMAQLGVKEIRNVQTAIFYEARGTYMNYEYYAKHDKTFITDVNYKGHKVQLSFARKMMKGAGEEVREHFSGQKLRDWYDYQKSTNQFADKYLLKADSVNYYWFSLGPVALGLSTYFPITKEETDLFTRFLKVFELAYRRYLDIEKAEAQAREAEIELSMERVRSKAMSMHDSGDILTTTTVSFEELNKLGIHSIRCGIGLLSKNSMEAQVYASIKDSTGAFQTLVGTRDMNEHPSLIRQYQTWLKQENSVETMSDEELESYYNLMFFKSSTAIPQTSDKKQYGYYFPFADGLFYSWSDQPYTDSEINILNRFKTIVALTFRRFLDLKKAEAQAREAQIELGLERVRARAMAMQKSDELSELVDTVFKELTKLDFALNWCMINIIDESTLSNTVWAANPDINKAPESYHMLFEDYSFHHAMMRGWKERRTKDVFVLEGREKKVYDEYLFNDTEFRRVPAEAQASSRAMKKYVVSFTFSNFGGLQTVGEVPLSDANMDILSRFGKVFDLTYTRFNDLQKAEAQAREAQIEASMERVRSRTMAMQKSAELMDVAVLLYNELKSLGITQEFFETGYVEIDEVNKIQTGWTTGPDGNYLEPFNLPLNGEPVLDARYEAWKQRVPVFKQLVSGEALKRTIEFTLPYMGNKEAEEITRNAPDSIIFYCGNFEHGYLSINSDTLLGAEAEALLARFTRVFEMTYKRFLDLKKAEAQAREAQIEASLERVRSRTMGMQKSEELKDVIRVVYEQFVNLNINVDHAGFIMDYKERDDMHIWLADPHEVPSQLTIPYFDSPHWNSFIEAKQKGSDFFTNHLDFKAKNKFYRDLFKLFPVAETAKKYYLSCPGLAISTVLLENIGLYIENFSGTPYTDAENAVLMRFGKVFEQAYIRFNDLKQAEQQARASQIELALERVRSLTMAMNQTSDLDKVNKELLQQLHWLKVEGLTGVSFMLIDEHDQVTVWDLSSPGNMGDPNSFSARYDPRKYPLLGEPFHFYRQSLDYFIIDYPLDKLKKGIEEWRENDINIANAIANAVQNGSLKHQWNAFAKLSNGLLSIDLINPPSDDTKSIVLKMASAFNLAYQRFLDLQKAEFQTHQAKIETALEKVRARALAMQQPEELTEVAQVMRYEMGLLGVEELETSSIYIHEDGSDQAECWYAIKDIRVPEKNLVADHFVLNLQDTWVGRQMFDFYQSTEKQVSIPMKGANRKEWINYCSERSKLLDGFYGDVIPERTYHLYKFSNGTIGAATPGNISNESWDLLHRAASVFSLAYSRFKDLTQARTDLHKLKEEKQRAENALAELQTTQKQLIQAEKMASLGELTAGIAHEIQNPLNFVNNFSDINTELSEELSEAAQKGDLQEVLQLANDIRSNQEKISEHGKRADAIVKGMLQHSRSSSGVKELTNINALADEYLRLAYHGLKAKNRSFNANIKTDFDESIGTVNIIPQEIGRVLLNLINNAFYAVNEKKKQFGDGYDPEVTVSTQLIHDSKYSPISQSANSLIISVRDNGNGIPQKILDKIFQPFFTTKPTGQGTGLGLSLSYDIVKAHGGELGVETEEGKGTEFRIRLPIQI